MSKAFLAVLFLLSLVFFRYAGAAENLPVVTYLEGMLEKEVSWPVVVKPVSKIKSKEGPRLRVWLGVPNLMKLGPTDGKYKIYSKKRRPLSFKNFNAVNNYIYFETNKNVSLFKFMKKNSGEASQEIALKISFPEDTHFVQFSARCKRKWILEKFTPASTIQPLLTFIDCPTSKEVTVKTSPEVEFPSGKKQLNYSLQRLRLSRPPKESTARVALEIMKGTEHDQMQMALSSIGDVVEQFNYEQQDQASEESEVEFKGLSLLGFSLSKKDPEVFGEVAFKKQGWRRSLELGGYLSLPYIMRGSSVKNLVDGHLYFLLNNPLNNPQSIPKYSFSLGPSLRKASSFQLGPQIRLGAQKLYSFSKRASLGTRISVASYGEDRTYELDTSLSFARKDGVLMEPHLILQDLEFESDPRNDFIVKLGFGARW